MEGQLTLANVGRVKRFVSWSVKFRFATIAVDSLGVVPAILTHTAALVITVDIQGQVLLVHFRFVYALVRVTETVASWGKEEFRILYDTI